VLGIFEPPYTHVEPSAAQFQQAPHDRKRQHYRHHYPNVPSTFCNCIHHIIHSRVCRVVVHFHPIESRRRMLYGFAYIYSILERYFLNSHMPFLFFVAIMYERLVIWIYIVEFCIRWLRWDCEQSLNC
jgi:hypothetical protein